MVKAFLKKKEKESLWARGEKKRGTSRVGWGGGGVVGCGCGGGGWVVGGCVFLWCGGVGVFFVGLGGGRRHIKKKRRGVLASRVHERENVGRY